MKAIYLHGDLKDRFGEVHFFDAKDPAEAIRSLCIQIPGFEKAIQLLDLKVLKGSLDRAVDLTETSVRVAFGGAKELHIVPRLALGKKQGAGKFLVGILLVAASFAIPAIALGGGLAAMGGSALAVNVGVLGSFAVKFSTIAMFGLSMALTGLATMLTPTPKTAESGDKNKSHLINGVSQLYEQGNPVPLAYGLEIMVGSVVISSAVTLDDTTGMVLGGGGGSTGDSVNPNNENVYFTPGGSYSYGGSLAYHDLEAIVARS